MDFLIIFTALLLLLVAFPASIIAIILHGVNRKRTTTPSVFALLSLLVGFQLIAIFYNDDKEEPKPILEAELTIEPEYEEKSAPAPLDTPEEPVSTDEFAYGNMAVKYLKHEIVVDDIGQTVLIIYFEFTNNSGENQTFDYSFNCTCFQHGVEIDNSWWYANEECKNSDREIKSGTTITVASSFVLGDSRDDVELEITPFISDTVLLNRTLALK